jgi:serine/threonine protein kinase
VVARLIATEGVGVLSSRYELYRPLEAGGTGEAWLGVDENAEEYLVRLWPFEGESPDLGRRALWDLELRTLYRVGSSPGAELSLLTLHDAGVDREHSWFVMVLAGEGTTTLAQILGNERKDHPWLSQSYGDARVRLWEMLERLAQGLELLHDQQIIHRNVTAESVFFDPRRGEQSARLGGFEWSIRLGVPHTEDPPMTWAAPPERLGDRRTAFGFRPSDDWFGFGMLTARCILRLENYRDNAPAERYRQVLKQVDKANASQIKDVERALIAGLIANDPLDRLTDPDKIRSAIEGIIAAFRRGPGSDDDRYLVLAFQHRAGSSIVEDAIENGFEVSDGSSRYNAGDAIHRSELCAFLRDQFAEAELVVDPTEPSRTLVGTTMSVNIGELEDRDGRKSWSIAYAFRATDFRGTDPDARSVVLPRGSVDVRTILDVRKDSSYAHRAASWEAVLPRLGSRAVLRRSLTKYLEFVRATHQLELLFRYAEIFPYRVISGPIVDRTVERIVIAERDRTRELPKYCMRVDGGLSGFIQDQLDGKLATKFKEFAGEVVLTPDELGDQLTIDYLGDSARWQIDGAPNDNEVTLIRSAVVDTRSSVPPTGFLRAADLPGQIRLFERQRRALDSLASHSYLLRSLVEPERVFIDTGEQPLPHKPPEWLDESKNGVLQDCLRVRPIYSLQGPPGTGKTTLVSFLIRQLMEDDPVVQILVTAQGHDAVDVLRAKVRDEAFADVDEQQRPLAVRLGIRRARDGRINDDPDLVENVAQRVLERSREVLREQDTLSDLQRRWVEAASDLISDLSSSRPGHATNFAELVKRSANLTYCTTSAGELEARSADQSFDWSIIEEAGKVHAFDLALPLHSGHRWLLIGDQSQLTPYRWENYRDAVDDFDGVAAALNDSPDKSLVDRTWLNRWDEMDEEEHKDFSAYARDTLAIFERVFDKCRLAPPDGERLTETASVGAAAGRLTYQHRMHPQLGTLISDTYYEGKLRNGSKVITSEGEPTDDVLHSFVTPEGIAGKPLVWVDMPSARLGGDREVGARDGKPRYTNPTEVQAVMGVLEALADKARDEHIKTAVLSPYTQQGGLLSSTLRRVQSRLSGIGLHGPYPANTVDSFQGNEADVVLVSLVRNNTIPSVESALGFLKEDQRMNVLFSRARQLLVVVGSFDFFVDQVAHVPITDEKHALWHWKKLLTTCEDWFTQDLALRLDGEALAQRGAAFLQLVGVKL